MEMSFRNLDMRLTKTFLTLLTLCLTSLSSALASDGLKEFEAEYKAFQFGKELGQASIKLESLGRKRYRMSYQSKISIFFLSDKRQEVSLFTYDDDKIIPFKYSYERTGFGSNKELVAEFNKKDIKILLNGDENVIPWEGQFDNQLYRLDIQTQLAKEKKELEYNIVNTRGQLRNYRIIVLGTEQITLPYGNIEGVKVKIARNSSKRETYAWFAPSLDYQLVRLQQFKEGEEQGDIQLSKFTKNPL